MPGVSASFPFSELAGRMAELCSEGSGALTLACRLVADAQRGGEPAAWVGRAGSSFFPPDAQAAGVDLGALVVVRAGDARRAVRAAELLLRSGSLGLVVLDLGPDAVIPIPMQSRLVGVAAQHHAALLCLTEKPADAPSLGSLVSWRGQVSARRHETGRFLVEVRVVKDKRRGPGGVYREIFRGPAGLR